MPEINRNNVFILWNAKTGELQSVEPFTTDDVSARLDWYYGLIDCHIFTFTRRQIGAYTYDLMVDDNGLMYDDYIVSLYGNGEPELVGNILFTRTNQEGETLPLTTHEVDNLLSNIYEVRYIDQNGTIRPALGYDHQGQKQATL